jgi:hypothetical protein
MTANFPSAYEIGNAVGNSLNPKLNDLQNQLNNIAQYTNLTAEQAKIMSIELEAIKVAQAALLAEINTMRQMAIARARAQSLQAKEKLNVIAGEVDEKKYELDLQKNAIQADYDKSQLEFIGNFAESVSADTKSIDEVKEDYKFIASMMKAAFDDSNALVALSVANFKARLDAITEKKKHALDSMNQFLDTRKGTVTQITKMQTKISRRAPCTVYVPFWMIGLKRGGTPRYIMLPVLESLDPAPPPPREAAPDGAVGAPARACRGSAAPLPRSWRRRPSTWSRPRAGCESSGWSNTGRGSPEGSGTAGSSRTLPRDC